MCGCVHVHTQSLISKPVGSVSIESDSDSSNLNLFICKMEIIATVSKIMIIKLSQVKYLIKFAQCYVLTTATYSYADKQCWLRSNELYRLYSLETFQEMKGSR